MSSSIACIAYKNGKIFIAKRLMKGDMGGRWEFPGGKIEEGESFEKAIVREMQEEFGVEVKVGEKITSGTFMHGSQACSLDVFEVFFPHDGMKEKFTLSEHSDYRWADLSEIPSLNFVDSDLKVYADVSQWLKKKYS
ncbi:MAG: NUDIX domain-containing protein [Treponema sp.]|nr:NUDIX domain-containing protein [Treponema sp.]